MTFKILRLYDSLGTDREASIYDTNNSKTDCFGKSL